MKCHLAKPGISQCASWRTCAFGVCTHAAPTYARAACANSHSQGQAFACFWVPSSLTSDSCLFPPDHRPHVSVSSGFPKGIGFLGNPAHKSLRVVSCSSYRPTMRTACELFRSHDLFSAPVGGCYPPRMLMSERPEFYSSRPITAPFTILVQAYQSVWLGRIYDGSDAPSVAFVVGAWLGKGSCSDS